MTEFGRSAHEQREFERVRYPGTDVLKNKFGLRNADDLERAELLFVADRLLDGLPADARRLDQTGLKAIHHHMFQDIYPWAGQYRTYTTGRGPAPFARPEFIEPELDRLFDALHGEKCLIGLGIEQFASRGAHYVNEINAIHPFIEGNGRAQRVWLRNLADHTGYRVRFDGHDRKNWNEASKRGFHGDNQPMADLIMRSIEPRSREQCRELFKQMRRERDAERARRRDKGHER